MIFPEALADEPSSRPFRRAIAGAAARQHDRVRQVATCSAPASSSRSAINVVIYPVTTLRLAMGAVEDGLREIAGDGTQEGLLPTDADAAASTSWSTTPTTAAFDADIFNFTLTDGGARMTEHRPEHPQGPGRRRRRHAPRSPKVVPETNSLTYRGYPVQDLAAHSLRSRRSRTCIWHGELPTRAELADFSAARARAARS